MAIQGAVVDGWPVVMTTVGKIRPRGLKPDNVADAAANRFSIQAAIDLAPKYSKPWGESGESRTARRLRIVLPAGTYYLDAELVIPDDVNIVIEGQGTTLVTVDGVDYAIFQDAPNGRFHDVAYHNLVLWKCGVRVKDQSRGFHWFTECLFKDAPDWAIKLEGAGDVDFASGGIVGGRISGCEFERCGGAASVPTIEEPDLPNRPHGGGAIFAQGDQSDNWLVINNRFSRNFGVDIKLYSSGWRIWGNYFEGRSGWDGIEGSEPLYYERPHIHLDGAATASVDIANFNRFGNELNEARGAQPPRDMIVIGPLEKTTEVGVAGHLSDVRIRDNVFRGCASPGPTQYRAQSAVRYNIGPKQQQITGNYFFRYAECLVKFAHANIYDGIANELSLHNWQRPAAEGPMAVFNRTPSTGKVGSWRLVGGELDGDNVDSRPAHQLLRNTENIHVGLGAGNFWGTGGNVAVTKDAEFFDEGVGSAYTFNKLTTGTAQILSTINPTQPAGTPIVASVWLKKVEGSGLTRCRLFITGVNSNTEIFELPDEWEQFWFTGIATGAAMTLFIAGDAISGSEVGTMEFAGPMVDIGTRPAKFIPRDGGDARGRPSDAVQVGPLQIRHYGLLPTVRTDEILGDLGLTSSGVSRVTLLAPLTWTPL